MEIPYKYHKPQTIYKWKRRGVIYHNLEELYETYINTINCGHCGKVFESTLDRCMDHCHETGLFRKIVCRSCNVHDCYLRFPDGIPSKQERTKIINKKYRENNKEKIKEKEKEYVVKNKDKAKEYREKNRDKINERRRELKKEKKQLGLN